MKITKNIITSIMAQESYGVSYEPIVSISNMETIAYEALSRFEHEGQNIPPNIFFESIHSDLELFFYVESIIKKFQVQNKPKGKKLFLNLDPHVALEENHAIYWVKFFIKNPDVAVEIIENSDEENLMHVEYLMDWLSEYDIDFVYDDYAKPNSVFFDSLFHRAKIIKLDINFIRTIEKKPAFIEVARGLIQCAKQSAQLIIMEGIETLDDLRVAKELNVDFVQGYLFRDKFIDIYKEESRNVSELINNEAGILNFRNTAFAKIEVKH